MGCPAVLMLLLRHGAKVTARDGHGATPLGIAAEHGNTEALDILIQHGKTLCNAIVVYVGPEVQNTMAFHKKQQQKRRHFKDIGKQKEKHF